MRSTLRCTQFLHFRCPFLLHLSILSRVVWPLTLTFHCGILLPLFFLDSYQHVLFLASSLRFSYFSSMSRTFLPICVILSLTCLYLSSPSSFIFHSFPSFSRWMDEFIPWIWLPTVLVTCINSLNISSTFLGKSSIFLRSFFWVAFHFSSDLLNASITSLLKYTVSSFRFVIFPSFPSSNFLFFSLSSSVSCVSICSFFSIPPNSLRDISSNASASMFFSFIVFFFSLITFPLCTK